LDLISVGPSNTSRTAFMVDKDYKACMERCTQWKEISWWV